jgi:hypothetical protein
MSYKTILTHCNDKESLSRLLGVAAPLAAAFGRAWWACQSSRPSR